MNRHSAFSYDCNQCGRCCHDQVITLSPVDVIAIARAAGVTTTATVERYTSRRGSLLRFGEQGACSALDGTGCSIHRGRPLACRLYPLGIEIDGASERFIRLPAAAGSAGVYGERGSIAEFLAAQQVEEHLALNRRYLPLLVSMRERLEGLVDFSRLEPREFRRRAAAEALREAGYDENRLITALYDPDGAGCGLGAIAATVDAHLRAMAELSARAVEPRLVAEAAVLLAVALGYSPAAAIG